MPTLPEITRLKIQLYHAILCASNDEITEQDINLGYLLAQDPDIQAVLERRKDAAS